MERARVEYWPAHLQSVFAVIGKSMGEKRLAPEIIERIPSDCGRVVAGHQVSIAHVSGKRPGPRSGHYRVTITGARINACWTFRSSELEKLSRALARAVSLRTAPDDKYGQGAEVW